MRSSTIRLFLMWCFMLVFSVSIFPQNISSIRNSNPPYKGGEKIIHSTQRDQATLELDNGTNYDAIGLTAAGTFQVAAQFTAAQTAQYTGWNLIQVQVYINDVPTSAALKIYDAGTATSPGTLLYSAPFTPVASSWQTIDLSTPVAITGGDIWVGYEVTHPAGLYPAGCDAGPAVSGGDWIYNGGTWSQLHIIAPSLNYNWNIAAVVEGVLGGPGLATDPNPANGATDVDINQDISWTNPAGATSIEVFWGTDPGNLTSVYSGSPISTFDPGSMGYLTTYYWKVDETDGTGTTYGTNWSYSTVQDPNVATLFSDDFESGTGLWTITNDGGVCDWATFSPPYPNTYTLPCGGGCGAVLSADADDCGDGMLSTATITDAIDATNATNLTLTFDNDFYTYATDDASYVEVSADGGATWTTVWSVIGVDLRNTTEVVDLSAYDGMSFMLRFRSVQPGWDWWWTIDNVLVQGLTGGSTAFAENFDGFTAGEQLACQDPTNWTTWSLTPCTSEDPFISDAYAFSGSNSAVIVENNDLVKLLGTQTSGTWYMSMMVYIPTGKAGYFNALTLFDGNNSEWGMECYFNAGGGGELDNGATVNFAWAENTWQQVVLMVDLDADQAELLFGTSDPLTSIASWQWSRGGTLLQQLDANDFFGATPNDEMYIDDFYFGQTMPPVIPVEFTTFSAKADNGTVVLNWATATETNNRGFEVQRSNGETFATIGFVNGNGTSTQSHEYSFVDNSITPGQYSYRLKQVDFNGSFAYSQVVEANVTVPMVYSLAQNYPNPFNPTTQINFSLASDSKVTLKIFDILGQEVATLLNGNLLAGTHFVSFNASNLTSGVYLYRIDATGADGSNFTAVKKMLLTK